jgi:carbon-monoxide dehydrogenase small subunit
MFDDVAAIAACLPGASLTAPPKPARVEGEIRVRIGPIVATFSGAARVERSAGDMSGRIVGIGNDRRSRSSTQGEIRYSLVPIEQGAATRVDLSIGYTLTGMLAQVGRPGLVRDLAARLIAEFAGNLDRRLTGISPGDVAPAELSGMSLVSGLLRTRVERWFGRFSSNKDGAA